MSNAVTLLASSSRPSSLSPSIGTSPRSTGIGRRLAEKHTDSVHYLDGGVYEDHAADGDT